MREGFAALAQRADKYARERSPVLKGLLRIRRTTSKKLRTHSKKKNNSLGFSSERLTRLCGAGAPFRPLFRPIPSYFVPGPKIFPFQLTDSEQAGAAPLRVKASLTNTEVYARKLVLSNFSIHSSGKLCLVQGLWPLLCPLAVRPAYVPQTVYHTRVIPAGTRTGLRETPGESPRFLKARSSL